MELEAQRHTLRMVHLCTTTLIRMVGHGHYLEERISRRGPAQLIDQIRLLLQEGITAPLLGEEVVVEIKHAFQVILQLDVFHVLCTLSL